MIALQSRPPKAPPDDPLVKELSTLLAALKKPGQAEHQPLAGALIPCLRERFTDLADETAESVLIRGLARVWQETAGAVPLSLAHQTLLEKYFTLMVYYFYPALHGLHRYRISSEQLIGPVRTLPDAAGRCSEREYLALIYADGDVERARESLKRYGPVFDALTESELDGLAVPIHPNTVDSRRKVGIQILAARLRGLLGWPMSEPAAPTGAQADPETAPLTEGQSAPAEADPLPDVGRQFALEVAVDVPDEPLQDIVSAGEARLRRDALEEVSPLTFVGADFDAALRQDRPAVEMARMLDQAFASAGTPTRAHEARCLAQQLAAIALGLEPAAERTHALTPANVSLALRRVHPILESGQAKLTLLDVLAELGLLHRQDDTWEFPSPAMAAWFAAEYIATYAGHRFLPQARLADLMRWACELLAGRGDDERNALLIEDMAGALRHLHQASLLDIASLVGVFHSRETPTVRRFREVITPEVRRLAQIPSGILHRRLKRLDHVFGPNLARDEYETETVLSEGELARPASRIEPGALLVALGLPTALASRPDWHQSRPVIAAMLRQVSAPTDRGLALACAAWLQKSRLTQILEVDLSLGWPIMRPVSALDLLVGMTREHDAFGRQLALSVLASPPHLELLLNNHAADAQASAISLLLLTERRATWDSRAQQWRLLT